MAETFKLGLLFWPPVKILARFSTDDVPACSYMMSLHETLQTKYHLQLWGKKPNCDHVPSPNIHMVRRVKVLHQSTPSAGLPRSRKKVKPLIPCWNSLLFAVMSCFPLMSTSEFFCLAVNPLVSELALTCTASPQNFWRPVWEFGRMTVKGSEQPDTRVSGVDRLSSSLSLKPAVCVKGSRCVSCFTFRTFKLHVFTNWNRKCTNCIRL